MIRYVLGAYFLVVSLCFAGTSVVVTVRSEVALSTGLPSVVLHSTVTMTKMDLSVAQSGLSRKETDVLTLPLVSVEPGLVTNLQVGIVSYGITCGNQNPPDVRLTVSVDDGKGGMYTAKNIRVLLNGKPQTVLLSYNKKRQPEEGEGAKGVGDASTYSTNEAGREAQSGPSENREK